MFSTEELSFFSTSSAIIIFVTGNSDSVELQSSEERTALLPYFRGFQVIKKKKKLNPKKAFHPNIHRMLQKIQVAYQNMSTKEKIGSSHCSGKPCNCWNGQGSQEEDQYQPLLHPLKIPDQTVGQCSNVLFPVAQGPKLKQKFQAKRRKEHWVVFNVTC